MTPLGVEIYTSSRWLDGKTEIKMLTQPSQAKWNFFFYDDVMQAIFLFCPPSAAWTGPESDDVFDEVPACHEGKRLYRRP
jgi:hypothetical protein